MANLNWKIELSLKTDTVKIYAMFSCILTSVMFILGIVLKECGYITAHCWILLIAEMYNLANLFLLSKNYFDIAFGTPEYLHDGTPNSKIVIEWRILFSIVIPGILLNIWMFLFQYGINAIDDEFYIMSTPSSTAIVCQVALCFALFYKLKVHFVYDDVTEGKDILLNILCAICAFVISTSIITYGNWCFAKSIEYKTIVLEKTISSDTFGRYRVLTDLGPDKYYVNKKAFNKIDVGDTVVVEERKGLFCEDAFFIKQY